MSVHKQRVDILFWFKIHFMLNKNNIYTHTHTKSLFLLPDKNDYIRVLLELFENLGKLVIIFLYSLQLKCCVLHK